MHWTLGAGGRTALCLLGLNRAARALHARAAPRPGLIGPEFERTGAVFVHIPKTGGISLQQAVFGVSGRNWHYSAAQYRASNPDRFDRLTSFAVMREPVDRLISAFHFYRDRAEGTEPLNPALRRWRERHILPHGDVESFAAALGRSRLLRARVLASPHFRPQAEFVADPRGRVMVDALFRFDRLDAAADWLSARLGREIALPRRNASGRARAGADWLSEGACATIRAMYAEDAALWEALCAGRPLPRSGGARPDMPRPAGADREPLPGPGPALAWDAVVATRNRAEVLALSLPLLARQTRPPAEIVVVDSSDDPAPVARAVEAVAAGAAMPVRLIRSAAGSGHQRNVGLAATGSPVVVFPDDDSLLYPDAAERILAVYERDREGRIAAVGGREARRPPAGTDLSASHRPAPRPGPVARAIGFARGWLKRWLTPVHPIGATASGLMSAHRPPSWLWAAGAVPVAYNTGFRMSFRRAALGAGFDETLTRYAWYEDCDAHFAALGHGLTVAALDALVHHHRVPGWRGDPHAVGLWSVLNRGYVAMKHVRANPQIFRRPGLIGLSLRLYAVGRMLAYLAMARDRFGWRRFLGAAAAARRAGALASAPADALAARYRALAGTAAAEPAPRGAERTG